MFTLSLQTYFTDMSTANTLDIAQLPHSDRTLMLGANLMMISDNLDSPELIDSPHLLERLRMKISSPFRIEFTIILLCVTGRMTVRVNMLEYEIEKNSILIIPEGAIGECCNISSGSSMIMIAFSQKLNLVDNPLVKYSGAVISVLATPCIVLSPDETQNICTIYNIMRTRLDDPSFTTKKEMAESSIMMIFNYISQHLVLSESMPRSIVSDQGIFISFMQLLDKYCTVHRDIAFYASKLSITSRRLSNMVLRSSGRSVKDWITSRLILEAKVLLNRHELSILQISEMLGFPNQSFFGSYFRRATGLSPLAYRRDSN